MKIAFVFWQNPRGYSGGRYHAWLLALSLANNGHIVTVWVNALPTFLADFGSAIDQLNLVVDPSFSSAPFSQDRWVIFPHQGADKHLHYVWLAALFKQGRPIAFVSFETPNWLAAEGVPTRGWINWRPWLDCANFADVIFSSSATGDRYARSWYGTRAGRSFAVCSPPCNEAALTGVVGSPRDIDVLVFARAGARDYHKGGHLIVPLLGQLPAKCRVMIFGETSRIAEVVRDKLAQAARHADLELSFSGLVDDRAKYAIFGRAKVVACLSLFEGFGYTPVEARVNGARLVAFDIPIFRELHHEASGAYLVPLGEIDVFGKRVCDVLLLGQEEGGESIQVARNRFSFSKTARQFEQGVLGAISCSSEGVLGNQRCLSWLRMFYRGEASARRLVRKLRSF
jgi:glycosyltransferase involved in cell wall biosynthesis